MGRLFGTDGIRGVANEWLTPELAMNVGRALGLVLSKEKHRRPVVMIGSDTRLSSEMLEMALSAGLHSVGADTISLGVISTPAVAYLVKKHKCRGGVVISASHNPFMYNGIKIFGEDGFKLSDELEEQIESIVLDKSGIPTYIPNEKIGRRITLLNAKDEYINWLIDSTDVNLSGLSIGLDCGNGATAITAKEVFTRLGANCKIIGDEPNGTNINKNCGSTSMLSLQELVKKEKLDLGIAFDGDGDRCIACDENGEIIDGDYIMAILALKLKKEGKLRKNTVVGTVMTNFGFMKFCEENGIGYISAKVGDRYVLEIINQEGFSFGGEQSGHIIMRDFATTGDGQLTAVQLLSHIKKEGKSLKTLASVMKKYPQYIINVDADRDAKVKFLVDSEIKDILADAESTLGDGGRVVVRPSGTEPLIRVMVEGENEEEAKALCESLADKIRKVLISVD